MVTIATFENPTEAHAAKHCLEAEGIAAVVTDEAVGNWLSYMGSAIGGIKLQVAETDVARGEEVLFVQTRADGQQLAPWRCARCRETVDGGFEICWSCGGERDEFEDPDFTPEESGDDSPPEATADDDEDLPNAAPPWTNDTLIEGRPNPYSAGRLPADARAPDDTITSTTDEELEALATRAWRAAIIGIFVCPVFLLINLYSLWLLVRLSMEPGDLSPAGAWKCRGAWAVNLIAILTMLTVLSLTFGAGNG
jgi:hypothetical protein